MRRLTFAPGSLQASGLLFLGRPVGEALVARGAAEGYGLRKAHNDWLGHWGKH